MRLPPARTTSRVLLLVALVLGVAGLTGCRLKRKGGASGSTGSLAGPFQSVVATSRHTCTLDLAGHARCFGGDDVVEALATPTPKTPFVRIATAMRFACGLEAESRHAVCWGNCSGGICITPEGEWDGLFMGGDGGCVTRPGKVACFGQMLPPTPPEVETETLTQVTLGAGWIVGLRENGTLVSWGGGHVIATDPRLRAAISSRRKFKAAYGAGAALCLIDRTDGVECLSHYENLVPPAVPGKPLTMAFANPRGARPACILFEHGSGTLTRCTETNKGRLLTPVQNARDIAVGNDHLCALMQDGSLSCQGEDMFGQVSGRKAWY